MQRCNQQLVEAVNKLLSLRSSPTLVDFPLLDLSYDELSHLVEQVLPGIGADNWQDVEDIYPCSPMQSAILLSHARGSDNYQTFSISELRAGGHAMVVDEDRLCEAWQAVVDRHALLRTVFIDSVASGSSRLSAFEQIVLPKLRARVTRVDAPSDDDAVSFLRERAPMAMEKNKAAHALIICHTPTRTLVKLEMSHALMDGASMDVIFRDLCDAHNGVLSSREPQRAYRSLIRHLQNQSGEQGVAYWEAYLSGTEPCLFPTYLVSQQNSTGPLHSTTVHLEVDVSTVLRFCEKNDVLLSSVVYTAWAMVLRAYTNTNQVCFGYAASGRDAPIKGIEEAVGPFINAMVCKVDIDVASTLREIATTIQQDFLEALPHQHVSLSEILHSLPLETHYGLFNTGVSVQRSSTTRTGQSDGGSADMDLHVLHNHDPSEFAITVNVGYSAEKIDIILKYRPSAVSDQQMAGVASTLRKAMAVVVSQPAYTVRQADLFSQRDRQLVEAWNADPSPAQLFCLHQVLESQAKLYPDAPAICSWDGAMTYRELEERSTKLAGHLCAQGAGPGCRIPLCFEKSIWAVVSILAVMKSGAAFVPLDPAHPLKRLQGLVAEVGADMALTSPELAHKVDQLSSRTIVVSDASVMELDPIQVDWASPAHPDDVAYIIFTSGSTGTPKGVVVDHRALCSSITAHAPVVQLNKTSRVFQFASYTFDASLTEILATLLMGGCVCVPSEQDRLSNVRGAMNVMSVYWAHFTPSMLRTLAPSDVPTLKTLGVGGEAVSRDVIADWVGSGMDVVTGYGPTEATIVASWGTLTLESAEPGYIGRAVGSQTWVVSPDNHDILVPVGSIGELVLSGPTLARGYLNDDKKTSEAFINGPFLASRAAHLQNW